MLDSELRKALYAAERSSPPDWHLRKAIGVVAKVESDMLQWVELIEKSRIGMLCESDWRTLSKLDQSYSEFTAYPKEPSIRGLRTRKDLRSQFPKLASELEMRIYNAISFQHSLSAEPVLKHVAVGLPAGPRHPAQVQSRVMPGAALRAHFAQGFPRMLTSAGSNHRAARTLGLGATALVNANGRLLYAGLRCCPHARLAGRNAVPGNELELAAAALVADPRRFRMALDGHPVVLPLCFISLGFAPEFTPCFSFKKNKLSELQALALSHRPVPLHLRESGGHARKLSPQVWVREFDVATNKRKVGGRSTLPPFKPVRATGEAGTPWRRDSPSRLPVHSLFVLLDGDEHGQTSDLGYVKEAMRLRLRQLDHKIVDLHREYGRTCAPDGSENARASALMAQIKQLQEEHRIARINAKTLEQAESQLRTLCQAWGKSDGAEPPGAIAVMIAARLALIGHLMGEIPILNCADSDLAIQVDSELKFLATVADHADGQLPPLYNKSKRAWRLARRTFGSSLDQQQVEFFKGPPALL